jgi:23S rRNA pseudouridine1911/1915/1917 synthase
MDLKILYEDKNFIAINKPAGILVHPTNISKEKTLVDFLFKKYPEIKKVGDDPENRPGVVHRLDKDTSGIILIARNQKYFDYLKKIFQKHEIKKVYTALVWGKVDPQKGIIDKPIGIKPGTIKHTVHGGRMVKEAITEYETIRYYEFPHDSEIFSLVKVMPKTGRTHQIRVHFAAIHHSVVGDPLYGKKGNPFGLNRQFLHAQYLEFNIAENKKVKIEADLPEDLKSILNKLETA